MSKPARKEYIKSASTSPIDSHLDTYRRRAWRTCKMLPRGRGMTSTPPSSVYPHWSRPSFHLARQMDGGQNNASNEVRYVPKNAPIVGPTRADQDFASLRSQLHATHCQSREVVNRWKGSKQLLVATMENFCRKGGQERPPLPGGGRSSPASPLPTTGASSNTRRRRKVCTEATEVTWGADSLGTKGRTRPILPSHLRRRRQVKA
jgi:hypothetical protein